MPLVRLRFPDATVAGGSCSHGTCRKGRRSQRWRATRGLIDVDSLGPLCIVTTSYKCIGEECGTKGEAVCAWLALAREGIRKLPALARLVLKWSTVHCTDAFQPLSPKLACRERFTGNGEGNAASRTSHGLYIGSSPGYIAHSQALYSTEHTHSHNLTQLTTVDTTADNLQPQTHPPHLTHTSTAYGSRHHTNARMTSVSDSTPTGCRAASTM